MKRTHLSRITTLSFVAGLLAGPAVLPSQSQTAVQSPTRAHVETLASERFEGRQAGSDGARLAADYLVSELTRLGARPLPGQDDFRLPFSFTAGVKDGGSSLTLTREGAAAARFAAPSAVQALSFADNAEVSGEVVFAGYGLVVPESQNFGYDSYATLDVTDKIVVVLRYFPEDADQQTRAILSRYSDLRYKAMQARQRGARALLVVTGPRSPNAGEVAPMTFDTALAGSGIVAASISGEVAQALFAGVTDRSLEEVQQSLDTANPHVAGFALPGVTVSVTTAVERQRQTGYNVAGYLPATRRLALPKPWVALGAHYDHLGLGTHGNSLARGEEAGRIHHGADDNASGTAAVLAIGEALRGEPRSRHVVLAFWSAEEIGLIGSNAFVTDPPVPVEEMAAYFNFDMVGRMQENKLTLQATGTSPAWARLIEQANVLAGFDLQLMADPYQPTDVASFNQVNVPSLSFFTGTHADYHRPSDTAEKINYEDLDRIVDFAASLTRRVADLDEAPAFTRVEQTLMPSGGRSGIRIFTGTIPDYATDVKGLLLGGVIGGGPAEAAGLQKGDVIIEIAEQAITNIYDYTYALDLLRIGQPAKVVYMRGAERRETTLTPAARR
ncbi:MAG: M20/M25/M40 family metallo-hydrolase [Vicinamibacterales bacterium]|nr:M20/M25/M40 family metallo-hydrolase [Vicinamibacterales bacterium]